MPIPTSAETDAIAWFKTIGLSEHLGMQRSNGLVAMVNRIRAEGKALLESLKQKLEGATARLAEFVARAAPDGATLLAVTPAHVINATLHEKLAYRWDRDFVPIVLVGVTPNLLVCNAAQPAKTLASLDLVCSTPCLMTFCSSATVRLSMQERLPSFYP